MEYGINGKWNTVLNSRKYYIVEHLDLLEYNTVYQIRLLSIWDTFWWGGEGRFSVLLCETFVLYST